MTQLIHDIPGPHRDHIAIPANLIAGGTVSYPIWSAPWSARIRDIVVSWGASLTGNGVNYARVVVTNRGTDGLGVTTLATVNYNSGAVQGFDLFALYDPATWLEVATGTVISITISFVNAGENLPPAMIFVEYEAR